MAKMLGKHAFLEQLVAEGVRHLFGNPGSTETPLMDALQDYPQVEYIMALQEASAVAMADGYARASRRPAVINLHVGPGLANGISMLFNAARGGTPLIVTAGQQDTRLTVQEPILWADLVQMVSQFTKWQVQVAHARDIPLVMRRAFKVAMQPPRGPVFVALPQDVLDQEAEMHIQAASYPHWRSRPDPEAVARAADLLGEAVNPILVCGDGVAVSGAQREVAAVAEFLGARVFTSASSEVNFPTDHPLYMGGFNLLSMGSLRELTGPVDVMLVLGGSFLNVANQLLYSPTPIFGPETMVIQMGLDPWEIAKNFPIELGIVADPRAGLVDLLAAMEAGLSPAARRRAQARAAETAGEVSLRRQAAEEAARQGWDSEPIAPARLMGELRGLLPRGAVLVGGGGTSGMPALQQAIPFREPGAFFGGRGGSLGFGLPGTIGVKLALPERPVVGVVAEGDGMYTNQALWTAAHYRVPVTWVIVNNASYRILKINMLRYLSETGRRSSFIGMDLVDPPLDYARLAHAFGIHGVRVERPGDIRPALKEALGLGAPAVVDVVVDGSIPG